MGRCTHEDTCPPSTDACFFSMCDDVSDACILWPIDFIILIAKKDKVFTMRYLRVGVNISEQ
ncbi:hypothetical protein DFA_08880 [Cavenderia fasciculata]|uniref:Uncharacterized protein n=1 Tax=Cavenderia fasciculata TaxID=261658 RepID=F4Q4T3_CACFS|nr:uncharacterized protein DFA_08880 [Cavenderia fasciculata]EGG17879.1 hypothetical protein DFA_08880 [Cavenderia fasciculata]|eukprot:XP_004356363.1 hypothetical protein DFA_08880 [Cavenderia fasciculata]